MRQLALALLPAAFLVACTGTTPTGTPSGNASPGATPASGQPGATPTTAVALNSSSRLTLGGANITAFDSVPKITWIGGGLVTVVNPVQDGDRTYSLRLEMKSLKIAGGLTETFKQEDVDRLELTIDQVVSGRGSGNKWSRVYDVPGAGVTGLKLTNAGGRLAGTLDVTGLKPAESNEPGAKNELSVKYEFENAITKQK